MSDIQFQIDQKKTLLFLYAKSCLTIIIITIVESNCLYLCLMMIILCDNDNKKLLYDFVNFLFHHFFQKLRSILPIFIK